MPAAGRSGPALYDARGNYYFVATPEEVRAVADMPARVRDAAAEFEKWTGDAVSAICAAADRAGANRKAFNSDGLLVGPFLEGNDISLLIVNTSGTLAELSGNGLTIFAQYLRDRGMVEGEGPFSLHVHRDPEQPAEQVRIVPARRGAAGGFWVEMKPRFGPAAVNANEGSYRNRTLHGMAVVCVHALAAIDESWEHSLFVSVGNPHCVTFLDEMCLPPMSALRSPGLEQRLVEIAYDSTAGEPRGAGAVRREGINLQWAAVTGADTVAVRIFERGEGATDSSGSSATAVASAARRLGLVDSPIVKVVMPGGTAPIRFDRAKDETESVMMLGEAREIPA